MKFENIKMPIKVQSVLKSDRRDYPFSSPTDEIKFTLNGIINDTHFKAYASSGNRMKGLYVRGTHVRDNRQWLAITPQEIEHIRKNLGIEGKLEPSHLGANLVIEADFESKEAQALFPGVKNLSGLPMMSYLVLSPHDAFEPGRQEDVVLVCYAQAMPCAIAGKAIGGVFNHPEFESSFPRASIGYRGLVGWVEKSSKVKPGYNGWILKPRGID